MQQGRAVRRPKGGLDCTGYVAGTNCDDYELLVTITPIVIFTVALVAANATFALTTILAILNAKIKSLSENEPDSLLNSNGYDCDATR